MAESVKLDIRISAIRAKHSYCQSSVLITLVVWKKEKVSFQSISFPWQLQFAEPTFLLFRMPCHLRLVFFETLVLGIVKVSREG